MNTVSNQYYLGGGFVYLEKDKRPSSAAVSTENRRKQNIKDMIQKTSAGNTQKDKFDMHVRYPGPEPDSDYTFQEEYKNAALNQKAGNNARQRVQSEMSFNQNNFQVSQDSPANLAPPDRARKAASTQAIDYENEGRGHQFQTASDKEKQERRMVLTEQLQSLQSQGFFKNIPKKEVISSYEGGLSELAPRSGMSFPNSQISQDNAIDQITSYLTKNFEHLQKSQGLSQYDLTNAISQAIESLNNLPPEQDITDKHREQIRQGVNPYNKGNGARQENQPQRAQKDFVIRHSKVSNPSMRNTGAETIFQGSSLQYQARNKMDEEVDLEDTMPYGGSEQLQNYKPQGRGARQVVDKDTTQPLTRMWNEALKDYERNDFEAAYEKILDSGSS